MQCQVASGRSDDHLETVISYGRRRRRSIVTDAEQAEKGDVLSMTMLTKSLLIRAPNENLPQKNTSQDSSRWTNSDKKDSKSLHKNRPNVHRTQARKSLLEDALMQSHSYGQTQTNVKGDRKKGELISGYVRVAMSEQSHICFEPLNLFIICVLSFCVQGLVFSVLFCAIIRCNSSPGHHPGSVGVTQPIDHAYRFKRYL